MRTSNQEMYKFLISLNVNEDILQAIVSANGLNEQTMLDVLYMETGFMSFSQI